MFENAKKYMSIAGNDYVAAAGIALLLFTLLPTIIALFRRHADLKLIFVSNLLLFWTWAGWVAVLVWAASGVRSKWLSDRLAKWNSKRG